MNGLKQSESFRAVKPLLDIIILQCTIMPTLQLPLAHTAPFTLLALGLFRNAEIQWVDASELSEPKYGNASGAEAVRAELEKDLPGKEVGFSSTAAIIDSNFGSLGSEREVC